MKYSDNFLITVYAGHLCDNVEGIPMTEFCFSTTDVLEVGPWPLLKELEDPELRQLSEALPG